MIDKKNPIIIKDFNKGIADSPLTGFADMRNINIDDVKGIASVGKRLSTYFPPAFANQTFTADAGTDVLTFADHNYSYTSNNTSITGHYVPVQFTTTDTLPSPLAIDTTYFLIYNAATYATNGYKIATTYDNASTSTAINITDTGTGTHTVSTVDLDEPSYEATSVEGYNFIGDDNGNVWRIASGAEYYPGNDNNATRGMVAWKGYLFHFTGTNIDVLNISTKAWSDNWKSVSSSFYHYAIVGRDDRVYFCNKHGIGSILEKEEQTFDPSNAATYTYNASALNLPDSGEARYLAELGDNLMIASNRGRIYPWDRASKSFDAPLQLTESISVMLDANNLLYVAGGTNGNIYVTDGTRIEKISQIPKYLTEDNIRFKAINKINQELLFAVTNNDMGGIWSLDINTGAIIMRNKISGDEGYEEGNISAISSDLTSNSFFVAYGGTGDSMVDIISSRYHESDEAYLISSYYTVGTKHYPRTFQTLEIEFTKKLHSSDSFKIYYRENLEDGWTLIKSQSGTNPSTVKLFEYPIGHIEVQNIQIKIILDTSHYTANTHTQLKKIRLI